MEHCAEQILSGIKKEVEVQYVVPMTLTNNIDITSNHHINHQNTHHLFPIKETGKIIF